MSSKRSYSFSLESDVSGVSSAAQQRARQRLMDNWTPETHAVHCSNCRHAVVSGKPDDPIVRCNAREIPLPGNLQMKLWQLLRPEYPRSFGRAAICPHFDSMDDDT